MHACTGQAKKGVAWSGSSGWAGGLWGLAYACQPQTAHRRRDTDTKENSLSWSRKQKWHEAATKQASLNLHQNKHESWHGVTYTIAAVKTVEQYLFDSKRPYQGGFFFHYWGPQASPGSVRLQTETLVWPNYPISWSSGQTGRWWRLEHLWRLCLVWGPPVPETRPTSTASTNINQQTQKELCSETFQLNASRQKARLRC